MTPRFVFLDLETTGLEAGVDQITEAAWILDDGTERQFLVEHTRLPNRWVLENTDYLTRIAPAEKTDIWDVIRVFNRDCWNLKTGGIPRRAIGPDELTKPYMVGACPAFDDRFLRAAYGEDDLIPYHYHVLDIEAMALGALNLTEPPSLKHLRDALGIAGENEAAHTALADAREVKLIWDALRQRTP